MKAMKFLFKNMINKVRYENKKNKKWYNFMNAQYKISPI